MSPPEIPWEEMSEEERAVMHNWWHQDMSRQMTAFRDDMTAIKEDTAEVRDLLKDFKGAMRVLEIFGKLAKPLGAIALAITAIAALWHSK